MASIQQALSQKPCLCRCAVFFPAVLAAVAVFGRGLAPGRKAALLAAALLQPAALLIDHGHFQYNNLCLGLAVLPLPAYHVW